MIGVPIDGAANVFGDNARVVKNVTRPESISNNGELQLLFISVLKIVHADKPILPMDLVRLAVLIV